LTHRWHGESAWGFRTILFARKERVMPTLRIGTRVFEADARRVAVEAERIFKLSPVRRQHRLETAKTRISRAIGAEREASDRAVRHAAATILSQGIEEI
jgi:hypothetical protein